MGQDKKVTEETLLPLVEKFRAEGKKIIMTNGCFDLLHIGHVRYLQEARRHGDILIVALNSDRSMKMIKGNERPLVPEDERAEILTALTCVDYVILFDEADPRHLISDILPDVLIKGGDWTPDQIVGREAVERAGGKVLTIPLTPGRSTSSLIQTILDRYNQKNR